MTHVSYIHAAPRVTQSDSPCPAPASTSLSERSLSSASASSFRSLARLACSSGRKSLQTSASSARICSTLADSVSSAAESSACSASVLARCAARAASSRSLRCSRSSSSDAPWLTPGGACSSSIRMGSSSAGWLRSLRSSSSLHPEWILCRRTVACSSPRPTGSSAHADTPAGSVPKVRLPSHQRAASVPPRPELPRGVSVSVSVPLARSWLPLACAADVKDEGWSSHTSTWKEPSRRRHSSCRRRAASHSSAATQSPDGGSRTRSGYLFSSGCDTR
mmetsp:Transcript_9423/g.30748  ORF Transcript_9423/g.30748 Transcript_9423/m.30748 type:complete len:277 (-) Transcript_9423:310-1140(-)